MTTEGNFEIQYESVVEHINEYMKRFHSFPGMCTLATHGGFHPLEIPDIGAPVVPPITLSTTFQQTHPGVAKYDYSRAGNYSRECLERCIALLENGDHCSVFSSGLAALGAVIQLLSFGDHIVAFDDLYGGSGRYLRHMASNSGITSTPVDMRNEELFLAAIQPNTRMVLLETPSNPLMRLVDIEKIVELTKSTNKDILVVVDNTFMSPYFQNVEHNVNDVITVVDTDLIEDFERHRPLDFGADVVLHSLTKYMNGHSDVVMGALVTRNHPELPKQLAFIQLAGGAVPSPFDCFMCLRGLRTLTVRMRAHMWNGLVVAKMLEAHPKVSQVVHPGLSSHPQHDLALKQMRGFSGMITAYLHATGEQTVEFVKSLKLFTLAESLGGYESLIEIPYIMTHASVPAEVREKNRITDNMIRLSVGLEDARDLTTDLFDGLDKLN